MEILKNDVSNIGNRAIFLERKPNLKELPHRFTAFCNNFARLLFRKPLKTKDFKVCETAVWRFSHDRPPTALNLTWNCHPQS